MAYLTEKEKCILFSAIHREEKVCKEHGFDDLVQVCKRLTHLFSYNRFEREIRNKAIDEFVEKIKHFMRSNVEDAEYFGDCCCDIYESEIDEIAEQIKGE